jgi:DNA-directed RNA polymerase specialized sigma24 family protein
MGFGAKTRVDEIRRTFADNHDELMWLALFLTGNKQLAEVGVVDACALATTSNEIFHNWLFCWARRATISCAIEMKRRRIADLAAAYERQACTHRNHAALSQPAMEVMVACSDALVDQLDLLCRFALVMRGVENYSAADSARRLAVSEVSVEAAYCTALQSLERFTCELALESAASMPAFKQ